MTGYLADCLYSGMLSNVALNPITGSYVENAVGKRLAEAGLTVVGLADWQELGSNPSSERPYGQYFSIHVVFACNIDVMWVGGAMQVPPILMQSGIEGYPITETFTID